MLVSQHDDTMNNESWVIVVIEPPNFKRMRNADPITLTTIFGGGMLKPCMFPQRMHLCIAYEEEPGRLRKIRENVGAAGLLQFLQRNYEFDVSQGDGLRIWHSRL